LNTSSSGFETGDVVGEVHADRVEAGAELVSEGRREVTIQEAGDRSAEQTAFLSEDALRAGATAVVERRREHALGETIEPFRRREVAQALQ
jgi:hypothetical protein